MDKPSKAEKVSSGTKSGIARTIYFAPELDRRVEVFAERERSDRSRAVNVLVARGESAPELPSWLVERLAAAAKERGMSVSTYVSEVLTRHLLEKSPDKMK